MKVQILYFCLLALLISPFSTFAETKPIEIFNIEKGKVVKEISTSTDINKETELIISSVSGVYKNLDPLPHKGFMVKIPVDPPIHLQNEWFNDYVDEVVIIFSNEEKDPYLMIWDDENRPHFYSFQMKTEKLEKLLSFDLKTEP